MTELDVMARYIAARDEAIAELSKQLTDLKEQRFAIIEKLKQLRMGSCVIPNGNKPPGPSSVPGRVLTLIQAHRGDTFNASRIAECLKTTKQNASLAAARLTARGLISRVGVGVYSANEEPNDND